MLTKRMGFAAILVAALIFTVYSAKNSWANEEGKDTMQIDFRNHSDEPIWQIINDGVMGGLSQSTFRVDKDTGIANFSGYVSFENNGGFASVRTRPFAPTLDTAKGISLRIKGDGKRYSFRIRIDNNFDGISYQAKFDTKKDQWQEIEFSFSDFLPTFRGYTVRNAPALNPEQIRQLGFLISDKQEGKFELEIDWIKGF